MNPTELPHDVYGLVPYQAPLWLYVVAALLVVLLALVLFYFWKRYRNRNAPPDVAPQVDHLKECLKKLRVLEPRQPFHHKNQVAFYHSLSLLFREYLERTHDLAATDLTTEELGGRLQSYSSLLKQDTEAYVAFLKQADLIKFAEKEVSLQVAEKSLADVQSWVESLEEERRRKTDMVADSTANRNEVSHEV